MTIPENMNAGVQPIDSLMEAHGFKNHDLVAADPEAFLTHKEVAKARKGRQLTGHTQRRILGAWNKCLKAKDKESSAAVVGDLFNYRGR